MLRHTAAASAMFLYFSAKKYKYFFAKKYKKSVPAREGEHAYRKSASFLHAALALEVASKV